MRFILWLCLSPLIVAGCGGSGISPNSDLASHDLAHIVQGDLAGRDLQSMPADQGILDLAGVDLSGRVCSSGACDEPNCGQVCCGSGEWCYEGACHCGDGPACTGGNICASAGVKEGSNCGSICCGKGSACPG